MPKRQPAVIGELWRPVLRHCQNGAELAAGGAERLQGGGLVSEIPRARRFRAVPGVSPRTGAAFHGSDKRAKACHRAAIPC